MIDDEDDGDDAGINYVLFASLFVSFCFFFTVGISSVLLVSPEYKSLE